MSSCTEQLEPGRKSDTGTEDGIWQHFKIKHPEQTCDVKAQQKSEIIAK